MVERPHSIRGGPGLIPGQCSPIFGIWREVLGCNVYITSQYLTPAIIYRDIIYALYPSSTPPPQTTAIFRDFKKSTAMCKVHNVGLRYINSLIFMQVYISLMLLCTAMSITEYIIGRINTVCFSI
jgi:hypothetical protein